jgi:hypothetical protein
VFTQPAAALLPGRVGYDLLQGSGRSHGLALIEAIDWKNYDHDRTVTDIRWELARPATERERSCCRSASEWKSERVLRRELASGHLPDALTCIGGRRLALEVERTRKSTPRYLAILERYLKWRGPQLNSVLYVLPDKADLLHFFAVVLPAAVRKPELWSGRPPNLGLFLFTTRNALETGKTWSTAASPSEPREGNLWDA